MPEELAPPRPRCSSFLAPRVFLSLVLLAPLPVLCDVGAPLPPTTTPTSSTTRSRIQYIKDWPPEIKNSNMSEMYPKERVSNRKHPLRCWETQMDISEYYLYNLNGTFVSTSDALMGKVVLIVNTASECGFAHTAFKELVDLQAKYGRYGFVVVAVPSDAFYQEPYEDEELEEIM